MKPRLMYWWLFFFIFTLWALNGKAQSNVPSIPGWLYTHVYVNASGNTVSENVDDAGNLVKYYLGFEDANNAWSDLSLQKYIEKWEGQSRIPDKWALNRKYKEYDLSVNGQFISWYVKGQGGGGIPSQSKFGKLHLRYYALDGKARTGIITPEINLAGNKYPKLKFQLAIPKRGQELDELVVKIRHTEYAKWEVLESYRDQYESFVPKEIDLKQKIKELYPNTTVSKIWINFEGRAHLGGGINIDDVMIVDANNIPSKVGKTTFTQLENPVGSGTKLNELARFFIEIQSGVGYYTLESMNLEFKGANPSSASDAEKYYLYRTTTPYFVPSKENKYGVVKYEGGKFILPKKAIKPNAPQEGERNPNLDKLYAGQYYFWLVADMKADENIVKHEMKFALPSSDAVKLSYYDSEGLPKGEVKLPRNDVDDKYTTPAAAACKVYKCLMQDDFEGATTTDWQLSEEVWKIGKPHPKSDETTYKTAPTMAFSGEKVLATAKEMAAPNAGFLDGMYSDEKQGYVLYTKEIDAEFYKDMRLKAKYCLNNTPDDKFRLVLIIDKSVYNTSTDQEFVVWETSTRSNMNGWSTMNVDLSRVNRCKKFKFRFEVEPRRNTPPESQSGLFLDDIQILGDYLQKDLGIESIVPPQGFDATATNAKAVVTIKNYGKESLSGNVTFEINLNGVKSTQQYTLSTLTQGQTRTVEITGLSLSPNKEISNEKLLSITAQLDGNADDDKSNDTKEVRFYVHPTYDITENKSYPDTKFARLLHWYPEPESAQYQSSWVLADIDVNAKFRKPAYANPPYSHSVWTTGTPVHNQNEHSVLTGPIFDLKENCKKEFIIGYAYEGATTSEFKIEYRLSTAPSNWITLNPQNNSWKENWYPTGKGSWSLTTSTNGFVVAKAEIPQETGKIQFRISFTGGAPAAGVTISGFEVRAMRPDLRIAAVSPNNEGDICQKKEGNLKIWVENNGPVDLKKDFDCPVRVRVYEFKSADAYKNKDKIGTNQEGTYFTLLGEHSLSLKFKKEELKAKTSKEFDTDIMYPWNASPWGYHVEVKLLPETVAMPDEDDSNNGKVWDIVSMKPYFNIVKDVAPSVNGTSYTYYAPSFPHAIVPMKSMDQHFTPKTETMVWTPTTPATGETLTDKSYSIKTAGKLKLACDLISSYPSFAGKTCPQNFEFEVKQTSVNLQIMSVKFPAQEKPETDYGCYFTAGEKVEVVVKNLGAATVTDATLALFINGTKQTVTVAAQSIANNAQATFTVDNVKIPKGYSQFEVMAMNGSSENLSSYAARFHSDRLFRTEPVEPKLYWLSVGLAGSIRPVEKNTVNNYVGTVALYVAPVKGATYQWYRGNIGATDFSQLSPVTEAKPENYQYILPEVSGVYAVEVTYGKCGKKQSELVTVRTDDIELVNLFGVNNDGVCVKDAELPILLDLRNNSRTIYNPGQVFVFKVDVSWTESDGTSKSYTEKLKYSLVSSIAESSISSHTIGVLKNQGNTKKFNINGKNTIEVEFLGIGEGETPDGNKDNNKFKTSISVGQSPTITLNPSVIKKTFAPTETYEIKPTYSADANSYQWAYWSQGENAFIDIASATLGSYTVNGLPEDKYRVVAKNSIGCKAEKEVEIIQTDLQLASIISPISACSIKQKNGDYVIVDVANTGTKDFKSGTNVTLKLKVSLDGVVLVSDYELELPTSLYKVGAREQLPNIPVPGLLDKLADKSVNGHTLRVDFTIENATDVVDGNNSVTSSIVEYGIPNFEMKYTRKETNGSSTVTPIKNGEVLKYYDNNSTDFEFDNVTINGNPTEGQVYYKWEFGKDNLFNSKKVLQNDIDEDSDGLGDSTHLPIVSLTDAKVQLPNSHSKSLSTDKAGSGFYYMTVSTSGGLCAATKSFEFKATTVNIAVDGIEAPASRCQFEYQDGNYRDYPQVKVNVKNAGTENFKRGTKLDVKCFVYEDPALSGDPIKTLVPLNDNGESFTYILERELRSGDVLTVSLPFDIRRLDGTDGKTFYFKAEVNFLDEEYSKVEFDKTNNTKAYNTGENKSFMVQDYSDVVMTQMTVEDLEKQNQTLKAGESYSYESSYPKPENATTANPSKENRVILKSPLSSSNHNIEWNYGYGVKQVMPKAGDPGYNATSGYDYSKSDYFHINGSGSFTLQVTQKDGGKCRGTFKAFIATAGGDIFISEVVSPSKNPCKDGIEGSPIRFKIKNSAAIALLDDETLKVTYSLVKDGSTENLLKTTEFDVHYRKNDFEGGVIKEGYEKEVVLSETMPTMGVGKYNLILKLEPLTGSNLQKMNKNTTNDNLTHVMEFMPKPEVSADDMNGAVQNFYTLEAELGLKPGTHTNLHNFRWTNQAGETLSESATSSKLEKIKTGGEYTLYFKDQYGCEGSQKVEVHFPGYLVLVPEAIVAPKKGCEINGKKLPLSFKVRNAGKENFEISRIGIPVDYKLWDPQDPETGNDVVEPSNWNPFFATSATKTIAPDAELELSTEPNGALLAFPEKSSTFRYWNLKIKLGDATDGSHAVVGGKSIVEHSAAETQVMNHVNPKTPELKKQAEEALFAKAGTKNLNEIPLNTKFDLDAAGYTLGETYEWDVPEGYSDEEKKKQILEFSRPGNYKVKVISTENCVAESEVVTLLYKVEYTIVPEGLGTGIPVCVDKDVVTTPYTVKVKVTVEKADIAIPRNTSFTFKYTVTDELGDQKTPVVEHFVTENELSAGQSFEYTFTKVAEMPKGKNTIALFTSFNDGIKDVEGLGSQELRYVENPKISLDPEYSSTESPFTLRPVVSGGLAPYRYTWDDKDGGDTFEAEGGRVRLRVTDANNCQSEANTVVKITHKLKIVKNGEGRVDVQMYQEDGVTFEGDVLQDGAALIHGRKLRIYILPDVNKKYYLEYVEVNGVKIPSDKTSMEHIIERIDANVSIEVGFKKDSNKDEEPKGVEEQQLAQVVCVSPVRENLVLLYTQGVVRYEVLNSLGVRVLAGTNTEGGEQIVTPAQALRTGVYLVRVYAQNGVSSTLKIVKE